jgi:hypothetical protein
MQTVRLRCAALCISLVYAIHVAHALLQINSSPNRLVRSQQCSSCRIQRSSGAGRLQHAVTLNSGTRLQMSDAEQDPDDMPDELAERLQAADSTSAGKSSAADTSTSSVASSKSGSGDTIDWDNAWASKQTELQDASAAELAAKQARPAFSGRKEIVVTGNEEEGFTYTAIEANGSRPSDGGFRLADEDSQARKDIMARETQLVDAVAFDKVH